MIDGLVKIKTILRESEMPMFSDEELTAYIKGSESLEQALYELLLIKAENTPIELSGLTLADTAGYFKRLALMYRPFNTGEL